MFMESCGRELHRWFAALKFHHNSNQNVQEKKDKEEKCKIMFVCWYIINDPYHNHDYKVIRKKLR